VSAEVVRASELLIAVVLVGSAAAKVAAPASRRALGSLGLTRPSTQWIAWAVGVVAEAACGLAVAAGLRPALLVAAALFAGFAALLLVALRRGRAGQPCGCFGHRGRVSRVAVLRNAALAVAALVVYAAPSIDLSQRTAIVAAFVVVGLGLLGLAVAVAALAREIGVLRLALQSRGALEIPEEGPELGSRIELGPWVDATDRHLVLAVFVSAGCPMCQALGPSLAFLAQDPWLAVAVFDEERDRAAWERFAAPGAPFAVALDADGQVLAKGVANSLPQLESVIATAARRRDEPLHA
jgi:hypothetical protein